MAAPYYNDGATAAQQQQAPPTPVAVVSPPQFCAPYAVPLTVVKKAISLSGGDFVVTDANGAEKLRVKGAVFSVHDRRVLHDAAGHPLVSMREKVVALWEVFRGDSTNASDLLFTVKKASVFQLKTELDVFLAGNTAQQACDFKIKGSYFERSCAFYLGNSNAMIAQVFSMHKRWQVFRGESAEASDLLFTVKKSSIIQLKTELDVFLASNTAEQACDFKIKGSYFERSCAFYLGNSNTLIAQMNRQYTVSNVLLGKDTYGITVFPHVDYVFVAALVVILDEVNRDGSD